MSQRREAFGELGRRFRLPLICAAVLLPSTSQSGSAQPDRAAKDLQPIGRFDADHVYDFNIPRASLEEALNSFIDTLNVPAFHQLNVDDELRAKNILVGPIKGRMSARKAFQRLTARACAVHEILEPASRVMTLQGVPIVFHSRTPPQMSPKDLDIPRMSRMEALTELERLFDNEVNLLMSYDLESADDGSETIATYLREDMADIVGPIRGEMLVTDALRSILRGSGLGARWIAGGQPRVSLLIERGTNFFVEDCRENVLVIQPNILTLDFGSTISLDRRAIEATGASSVPEALRYISESGVMSSAGANAGGGQYINLRGLGPDLWLTLINGRRALPSSVDLNTSAFDLGTLPLSAVERIEIQVDTSSSRHGSDAIAGVINIVTVRGTSSPQVDVRYGEAQEGATEREGTLRVGAGGSAPWSVSAVVNAFALDGLAGRERRIPGHQDYTAFGGRDYRHVFGVRSLDGRALPGIGSSFASLPSTPNPVSLNSDLSLVPDVERTSFVGTGEYTGRFGTATAELIWVRKANAFRYFRPTAAGVMAAHNPYNPFGVPVMVDALLTGRPPIEQHVESGLTRAVLGAQGRVSQWTWSASLLSSREETEAWTEHALDPAGIAQALAASDRDRALDVFSLSPGQTLPEGLVAPKRVDHFALGGEQALALAEGPVVSLPAGAAWLQVGAEYRRETMQLAMTDDEARRSVRSTYAELSVPLVNSAMGFAGVHALKATAGVRRDEYVDAWSISTPQYSVDWDVTDRLSFGATRTKSFRPPSLYELYLPVVSFPTLVNDRGQLVPITFVSGGNPNLEPSRGLSETFYLSYEVPNGLHAQVRYFSIDVSNHIALLPLEMALQYEDYLPDRVLRAEPTGRLLAIDTRKLNYGGLATSGIDADLQRVFQSPSLGTVTAGFGATWVRSFEYSKSPVPGAPLLDRAGVADARGSITRWRAVGSLGWERAPWQASTHLRFVPSYHDTQRDHDIGSQTIWDAQLSYSLSSSVTITVDVKDLLDTSPHFAHVGAATGWDWSQWDPVGRRWSVRLKFSL